MGLLLAIISSIILIDVDGWTKTQTQTPVQTQGSTQVPAQVHAQDGNLEAMMVKMVKLRADVESLSTAVEAAGAAARGELDAAIAQRTDIENQLEKQKTRRAQIAAKHKLVKSKLLNSTKPTVEERKLVNNMFDRVESWIKSSLPFRTEARLKELGSLRTRMDKDYESMELIISDLVDLLERELKLAETNEYRIMDVPAPIAAKAEVVRLGLSQMYFQSVDGRVGMAHVQDSKWQWRDVADPEQAKGIQRLVAYFKQKKSSGFFQIPLTGQTQNGADL